MILEALYLLVILFLLPLRLVLTGAGPGTASPWLSPTEPGRPPLPFLQDAGAPLFLPRLGQWVFRGCSAESPSHPLCFGLFPFVGNLGGQQVGSGYLSWDCWGD